MSYDKTSRKRYVLKDNVTVEDLYKAGFSNGKMNYIYGYWGNEYRPQEPFLEYRAELIKKKDWFTHIALIAISVTADGKLKFNDMVNVYEAWTSPPEPCFWPGCEFYWDHEYGKKWWNKENYELFAAYNKLMDSLVKKGIFECVTKETELENSLGRSRRKS